MRFRLALYQLSAKLKRKINIVIRPVQHNRHNASVGILESSSFKLSIKSATAYALRALLHVLAEMSYVIVRIMNEHPIVL